MLIPHVITDLLFLFMIILIGADETIRQRCRQLLACAVNKNCLNIPYITSRFNGSIIRKEMYNDLDEGIDYGCILAAECSDECNKCPLCRTSKEQLIDVLSGTERSSGSECSILVNCATKCVKQSNFNFTKINYCLRHQCAYHCFDGSCPKCSAFITRLFNQICVNGNLRKKTDFKGQCYEMFRAIVHEKFEEQFKRSGGRPAIDIGTNLLWLN
ncbi:hypothetical protein ACH3XW_35205 [Acanthocheilonema viteae]